MSTSTAVKTARVDHPQHDRPRISSRSTFSSSEDHSSSGDRLSELPRLNHGKKASPSNLRPAGAQSCDALGISGNKSWESRPVGIFTAMREKTRRERGESDLGRQASRLQTNGFTFPHSPLSPRTPIHTSKSNTLLDEILNGVLLPLPFLLPSLAFPPSHSHPVAGPILTMTHGTDGQIAHMANQRERQFLIAGALSSAALLLSGVIAKFRLSEATLDRRKEGGKKPATEEGNGSRIITQVYTSMLSMTLPFYASLQLGGVRTALVLLLATSTGLCGPTAAGQNLLIRLGARKLTCGLLGLLFMVDLAGLMGSIEVVDLAFGYIALLPSALVIPPPVPHLRRFLGSYVRVTSTAATPITPGPTPPATPRLSASSSSLNLPSSSMDAHVQLIAGAVLAIATATFSSLLSIPFGLTSTQFAYSTIILACTAGMIFFSRAISVETTGKPGVAAGLILTAFFGFIQDYDTFDSSTIPFIICALCVACYIVAMLDVRPTQFIPGHVQDKDKPAHKHRDHSFFTAYLLHFCTPGSMLDTILRERDSRRIAYFGCLNLGFMMVQFFYGFVTGSLGLLTDSIHMLFDCLGLAVGLAAAVMSKWSPSLTFPYGYGKIDTLSGFANGIFLILVSIEIMFDAVHRLHEGHELRRLNELLLISTLGLLVNLVGLTAFGHAHHGHGHDHGHSHGHSHAHSHTHNHAHENGSTKTQHKHEHEHKHDHGDEHKHKHDHDCEHDHDHDHEHKHNHEHGHDIHDHVLSNGNTKHDIPSLPPTPFSIPSLPPLTPNPPTPVKSAHSHSHENENMQGIFLHVLADALGSVSVILSTLMTKYDGWSGWDPLASCAIAILIFLSAIPLVKSSGTKLLLALPNEIEYSCRGTLQGLSELRGVVGYAGVRVWQDDSVAEAEHGGKAKLAGVIHVIAALGAGLEDVGERAGQYLKGRGLNMIVHVEKEGSNCWCTGRAT